MQNFPKNYYFWSHDTHARIRGSEMFVFGKFCARTKCMMPIGTFRIGSKHYKVRRKYLKTLLYSLHFQIMGELKL